MSIFNKSKLSTVPLIGLGALGSLTAAFGQGSPQLPPPDKNTDMPTPPAVVRDISSYKNLANPWELPDKWSSGTTVYTIGGNKVLPQEKAQQLGNWISKNYPNWTVVVTDPAWTKAFEFAHTKSDELFHSQKFGETIDQRTQLPSGNLLLFAYKAGKQGGGDITWYSSPLMKKYGLSSGQTWNQRFVKFAAAGANHQNITLAAQSTISQIEGALQVNIKAEQDAPLLARRAANEAAQRQQSTKNVFMFLGAAGAIGVAGYGLARRRNSQQQKISDAENAIEEAVSRISTARDRFLEIDTKKDEYGISDPQFDRNLSYASSIIDFMATLKNDAEREFEREKPGNSKKMVTVERVTMAESFACEYKQRNGVVFDAITLEEALNEWDKIEAELTTTLRRLDPSNEYIAPQSSQQHLANENHG